MGSRRVAPRRTRATPSDEGLVGIHDLELKHQSNIHNIDLTSKDEDVRRMKTRNAVLRDENVSLRTKVCQAENDNAQLENQCQQYQQHLEDAQRHVQSHEVQTRTRRKEMNNLKAELNGVNHAMRDSTTMAEKYHTASAELTKLKPEVEHLRSQMTDYQELIATKLCLERSLNQAEVELEAEKRASQRARGKANQKVEDELHDRISDLEKELAAEKRQAERQRSDAEEAAAQLGNVRSELRETMKNLANIEKAAVSLNPPDASEMQAALNTAAEEAEEYKEQLQATRTALNTQKTSSDAELRKLKEQLKEAKSDLKTTKAQLKASKTAAAMAAVSLPENTSDNTIGVGGAAGGKRRANEMMMMSSTEQTTFLDTPELSKRPPKKRALVAAAALEKSNFSITPFLNRSKELSDVLDGDGELEDSILQGGQKPKAKEFSIEEPSEDVLAEAEEAVEEKEPEEEEEDEVEEPEPEPEPVKRDRKRAAPKTREPPTKKAKGEATKAAAPVLAESASARKNAPLPAAKKSGKKGAVSTAAASQDEETTKFGLEKVVEEPEDEPEDPAAADTDKELEDDHASPAPAVVAKPKKQPKGILKKPKSSEEDKTASITAAETLEQELDGMETAAVGKRKKRKLGAKKKGGDELDEDGHGVVGGGDDDLDVPVVPAAVARKAVTGAKSAAGGKAKGAGNKAVVRKRLGAAVAAGGAFGKGFSPLKKDRRGGGLKSFIG